MQQQQFESAAIASYEPAVLTDPQMIASLRSTIAASKSPATRKAYRHDWSAFETWCAQKKLIPMPAHPEVVAAYVDHRATAGAKYAYICRNLTAISMAHEAVHAPNPAKSIEVSYTMGGIRRRIGTAQRRVNPLLLKDIRRLILPPVDCAPMKVCRDKAILLIGFLGAMRRSEIVALHREHIQFCEEGIDILIARSKTDQDGQGEMRSIPYARREPEFCAVTALEQWLELSKIEEGFLFRGIRWNQLTPHGLDGHDIAKIIKARCKLNRLDPRKYSGHSLRAGLATQAFKKKVDASIVRAQTGHASQEMLDRYVRLADRWEHNVVTEMGL